MDVDMEIKVEKKPYTCNACVKSFSRLRHLNNHISLVHTPNLYKCDLCGKPFTRKSIYLAHTRKHLPFKCEVCNQRFALKNILDEHTENHTIYYQYECYLCCSEDSFNIRNREKPYYCFACEAEFEKGHDLYAHLLLHVGENTLECKTCSKGFSASDVVSAQTRRLRSEDLNTASLEMQLDTMVI